MAEEQDHSSSPDISKLEPTSKFMMLIGESQKLRRLIDRLIHCQETGNGSYEAIERDARRKVPVKYTDSVRDALGAYSKEYLEFMDLIYFYQYRGRCVLATIRILRNLLKDHPHLLDGFNAHLPDGYQIHIRRPDIPENRRVNQMVDLFNNLQDIFELNENGYRLLRKMLGEYHEGNVDIVQVKRVVEECLNVKPSVKSVCFHFIDELASCMNRPKESGVSSASPSSSTAMNNDQLNIPFEDRREDAKRHVSLQYINSVKEALGPESEEFRDFDSLMSSYLMEGKGILATIIRLKELLKEHQGLLVGFNAYLPVGYHVPYAQPGKPEQRLSVDFYTKVQEKLQDDDISYLSLNTILLECFQGNKDIPTVKQQISTLLVDRSDVTEICCNFVDTLPCRKSSDEETNQPQIFGNLSNDTSDVTIQTKFSELSIENTLGPGSQGAS